MVDQRRFSRVPFPEPVAFVLKGADTRSEGLARDICLGGMFVETATPAPFGAEVVVHFQIPGHPSPSALPGVVRWLSPDGMGVQFGSIGAQETHAITQITQANKR